MFDQDLDAGAGFGWDTPMDAPPAPTGQGVQYTFLGFDGKTDVYRGSDGQLYQGDKSGPNGFSPYTGTATEFSPTPGQVPTPPPPPPPVNPGVTPVTNPFNQTFTPPSPVNQGGPAGIEYIPPMPGFQGPAFPDIPSFHAPSIDDVMNGPNSDAYRFRVQQGDERLKNAFGAAGTLNDSSTYKALQDYGQNAASQEYANEWTRDYDVYKTDVNNRYILPWTANYQNWTTGVVQPGMLDYSTKAAAGMHQNDANFTNAWNLFLNDWDRFKDQRDSTFDKVWKWAYS